MTAKLLPSVPPNVGARRVAPPPHGGAFSSRPIRFTVAGPPLAWARSGHNGASHYTPARQRKAAAVIAWAAKGAMGHRPPIEGPVVLDIHAFMPIAKSWPSWKRTAAAQRRIYPTSTPDWDNLGKLVSDALNGVVWVDDAQVVSAAVHKDYCTHPRIEVEVAVIVTEEVVR